MMDALQSLEQGWRAGRITMLAELASHGIGGAELAELAAVDLEWRWRVAKTQAKKPEQYWVEFPILKEDSTWMVDLVEAEFVARSRWSQPPRIDEYCDRFRELGSGLRERLVERLNDVSLLVVRFLSGAEVQGRYVWQSPLIIGRRQAGASEVVGLSSDGHRLVVVENSAEGVSREHCKIERVQRSWIKVTNLSSRGGLRVGVRELSGGGFVEQVVPAVLEFCGVKLVVEEM
jgi:hypothetical protein